MQLDECVRARKRASVCLSAHTGGPAVGIENGMLRKITQNTPLTIVERVSIKFLIFPTFVFFFFVKIFCRARQVSSPNCLRLAHFPQHFTFLATLILCLVFISYVLTLI